MRFRNTATVNVDMELTQSMTDACQKLLELQNDIQAKKEELKKVEAEERNYSEKVIPELMQQVGVEMVKLSNGVTVETKPFYSAKIPVAKREEAFSWMRDNGLGGIIKNIVSMKFGREQDNMVSSIVEDLKDKGFQVNREEKVEPQTYKAALKEKVQNGENVPMYLLGLYVSTRTTIKRKE